MKMLLNGTLLLLLHFVVKSEAQYSTCKNTCEIEYEDDNKWGIENNEWCILPGSCFDTCWSSALGYPCCKGCDITSTDSDGDWGVENNEWCGILSSCKESNASCWSLAYVVKFLSLIMMVNGVLKMKNGVVLKKIVLQKKQLLPLRKLPLLLRKLLLPLQRHQFQLKNVSVNTKPVVQVFAVVLV
ncbi:hypothetical protein LY90DRAFT_106854 [Neocallimastix californiae]|uniref:CBM10 domain-containing protein n=1 Tax=Neocallimastix californiae TaxID=1754190 RepID=A0A1Y2ATT3_9FUNG|nr:hypothetical protein LY90DRAFT_106854 [Neocallimastix californiae]|eukprot:ORY25700.1 hypothetical protein LY90DRAFT_106854 [Neocallimastix californiae]